ncbi:MAG TPA: winged helix-turn-helix domain-containing protein [Rhodanobacteraceae bacterium]|nr:winged helix-turn-helix domain-containing protein [Rhodanobacteraceae bacterium]
MTSTIYHFGDFVLDPAARELHHGDALVALPPKSFDCLAYLVAHRERAVGRDELISAVWGRIDVNDALLAQTLLRARRAVGDTGSRQNAIRTVPRFGYRWVAPVDIAGDAGASATAPATSGKVAIPRSASGRRWWRRKSTLGIAVLVLLAMAAGVVVLALRQRAAPAANGTQPLVVVMPVAVGNGDPEWIRLGAMDYIAARLREGGDLSVLPSEQVVALVGSAANPGAAELQRIARATGARWIVRPSARRVGAEWSIRLIAAGAQDTREVEATGTTPLEAAADASARLLVEWGRTALRAVGSPTAPTALTERVQRIDAAMLGGDLVEARRLVDGTARDQRAEPALRVREGQLDFRAGDIAAAERIFTRLGANESPLPAPIRAQASMGLGAVAVRRGDFARAEKRYGEALAVLGANGDPNLVGLAYTGRGVARGAQANFDLSLADLGRARVALERAGNPLDAASVDTDLGLIEGSRRRYAQALGPFDRAIATFERFDVRDNLAASLLGKARAQLALLDLQGALASSKRGYELARDLENPVLVHRIGLTHAEALLETGRLREADAIAAGLDAGSDPDDEELRHLRARLALAHGNADAALAALNILFHRPTPPSASLLPVFVTAALRSGDRAAARRALEQRRGPAPDSEDAFALELARGEFAAATGDLTGATSHLRDALTHASNGGVPAERVRAGCAYARVLIAGKHLDQASAVVGELAPYADRDFRVAQITAALFRALGDGPLQSSADARVRSLAGERDPGIPSL